MELNHNILNRFFDGKYSRKDFLILKSVFESPKKKAEFEELLQNHWFDFDRVQLPDQNVEHILHKIHEQIKLESRTEKRLRFLHGFQRMAAILIVPLILAFLAVIYSKTETPAPEIANAEIQCPMGARIKFVLPDGTTGFLNSGSTLEYPTIFKEERNVSLKGEAFFDVVHDTDHPFVVETPNLSTKVLGTQFNVIAYENENTEEVILKEGSVEIFTNSGQKLETLEPDQNLLLDTQTREYAKDNVEAMQYVSWIEGKLVFRNEEMQQVANRLGRWYNVEIEIRDQELLKFAFRGTFIDEPLEEVLKLLAITAPMKYTIQEREITNNDTYKQKKVIVSLDRSRVDSF